MPDRIPPVRFIAIKERNECHGDGGEGATGESACNHPEESTTQSAENSKRAVIPADMWQHYGDCHIFAVIHLSALDFKWQRVFEE